MQLNIRRQNSIPFLIWTLRWSNQTTSVSLFIRPVAVVSHLSESADLEYISLNVSPSGRWTVWVNLYFWRIHRTSTIWVLSKLSEFTNQELRFIAGSWTWLGNFNIQRRQSRPYLISYQYHCVSDSLIHSLPRLRLINWLNFNYTISQWKLNHLRYLYSIRLTCDSIRGESV